MHARKQHFQTLCYNCVTEHKQEFTEADAFLCASPKSPCALCLNSVALNAARPRQVHV